MDLAAIKAKLDALNNQGNTQDKVDYSKLFWKPELGKKTIRIVPSAYNPSFPFTELRFHYLISKFPLLSLSNFGKQDPVEEFIKELKRTSKDKEDWSLAGKLTPKTRIFAPIIVRGEEEKGVRLWGFGVTIYKALLALAEDEDIGDFTDVMTGWDLVVEQQKGNPYPETSVRIKPKQSPLSDDKKQVELWLKEQPNPLESFNQYDYEFIKARLQAYINPSEEGEIPAKDPEPASEENSTGLPESDIKGDEEFDLEMPVKKGKKSATDKFDDLFNE